MAKELRDMKSIFIIRPVRGISEEYELSIQGYIYELHVQGHQVYDPNRHTNQNDATGLRICEQNRFAIEVADEVHVVWDGKSQGCLFDLGMAFALRKTVVPVVGLFPRMSKGKSFQNMVYAWQEA